MSPNGAPASPISRQSIRLARVVPGWNRRKEYLAEHIQDLRVSPQWMPAQYGHRGSWPGATLGQIAFDYGARTIRFADADEAEAKLILAEIQQRFPRMARLTRTHKWRYNQAGTPRRRTDDE
jgi:hypothetical protein